MNNKVLYLILIFTMFIFIFIPSYSAVQDPDLSRYLHRDVKLIDDETYLQYSFYTYDGYHEGKVKLPVNWDYYTIFYYNNEIYCFRSYDCALVRRGNNKGFSLKNYITSQITTYDFTNDKWNSIRSFSGYWDLQITPNDILYNKGMNLKCLDENDKNISVDYSLLTNYQELMYPQLEYINLDGFKLHLHDFYTKSIDHEPIYRNELTHVYLNVYDLNSKMYKLQMVDVLEYEEVKEMTSTSGLTKYIDIGFKNLLSFMQDSDGDYLIGIASSLDSTILSSHVTGSTSSYWYFPTLYTSEIYVRFQYNSTTKVGTIIKTDSEGNPLEPSNPDTPSQDDRFSEAINNQTQKIEEQTNAIRDQTQKIEDQTNVIKENNETNKNIFQQIIELPGKLINGLLDMIKGLFIPSDDFLNTYFNDLYNWFCDRLGFLSYPLQLIINILRQ